MRKLIYDYFTYTRAERNGILLLTSLLILLIFLPRVFSVFYPASITDFSSFKEEVATWQRTNFSNYTPQAIPKTGNEETTHLAYFNPNTADKTNFILLGLSEKVAQTILNYRAKGGFFRTSEDFAKVYGLSKNDYERLLPFIQLEAAPQATLSKQSQNTHFQPQKTSENFVFDPNTATKEDFARLGLADNTANSILNYRAKGGFFKKKEDFSKIYTLAQSDFERLAPFINIPEKTPTAFPQNKPDFPKNTIIAAKPIITIDINAASMEDWQKLNGIGAALAGKIVNFRTKLGGFTSVEQIKETYNLPDSTFQKIKSQLQFQSPIFKKININTASIEELQTHPYLKKKQAEILLLYRKNHGNFANVEDLQKTGVFPSDVLGRVKPYFSVE
jgi:competence ComEA-like helix-hairpin-helix protein